METNSRSEAAASPVKQGQYSPPEKKRHSAKGKPAACGRTGISGTEKGGGLYEAHRKCYGKRQPT